MHIKKLLLITHYFPAHRGGVEIVAGELAARLANSHAIQIRWLASDMDPSPERTERLNPIPIRANNAFERYLALPYPFWSAPGLIRLVREVKASDIVHLHDFIYFSNIVAFVAARLFRKPVLITQHIGFIPYRNHALRMLLTILNRMVGALMLRHAERVVFISESVRAYFDRFVRYRQAPAFVPNGVDHQIFYPTDCQGRTDVRKALGLHCDDVVFLFVGRFVEKKGLPLLRFAAERVKNVKWIFAGAGPCDPETWCLPNVTVLRNRTGASLADVYRASDLLVLPSKGEGFPLVVQESMACGTPCLIATETATSHPGLQQVTFAVDVELDGAEQRFWERLSILVARRTDLQTMRSTVAEFAQKNWSWDLCAEKYVEILQDFEAPIIQRALSI